jgi:hypothetical protein
MFLYVDVKATPYHPRYRDAYPDIEHSATKWLEAAAPAPDLHLYTSANLPSPRQTAPNRKTFAIASSALQITSLAGSPLLPSGFAHAAQRKLLRHDAC